MNYCLTFALLKSTWVFANMFSEWRSQLPVDGFAEDPEAGHHLVPVQVSAFQVSQPVRSADVAPPPVQQAPVVEGHDVAWRPNQKRRRKKWAEGSTKAQTPHLNRRLLHLLDQIVFAVLSPHAQELTETGTRLGPTEQEFFGGGASRWVKLKKLLMGLKNKVLQQNPNTCRRCPWKVWNYFGMGTGLTAWRPSFWRSSHIFFYQNVVRI